MHLCAAAVEVYVCVHTCELCVPCVPCSPGQRVPVVSGGFVSWVGGRCKSEGCLCP